MKKRKIPSELETIRRQFMKQHAPAEYNGFGKACIIHFVRYAENLVSKPVETTNEQPKIIVTQLMKQFVTGNKHWPIFTKKIEEAKKFDSHEEAKSYIRNNFGKEIVFQYIISG